jgi:secondary thiamine-phosphate synthase enzyme
MMTNWEQVEIRLQPRPRGFHVVTAEIVAGMPALTRYKIGIAHIFIQHTSASLAINEAVEPEVRLDMESHFNNMVQENMPYYLHNYEGADDMPAHIKAALLGSSLTIPITNGRLNLGTWQGIYLCEHRNRGGVRKLVVTLQGEII